MLLGLGVGASVEFELAVDDIQGADWGAQGLSVSLTETSPGRLAAAIQIRRLTLPEAYGSLDGLRLACPTLLYGDGAWELSLIHI